MSDLGNLRAWSAMVGRPTPVGEAIVVGCGPFPGIVKRIARSDAEAAVLIAEELREYGVAVAWSQREGTP